MRMQRPHPDADMNWILRAAAKNKKSSSRRHKPGSVEMEKYGLLDDVTTEKETMEAIAWRHNQIPLARLPVFHEHLRGNAQSTSTTPPLAANISPPDGIIRVEGSPAREESVEEQMLRRRRREAMVLEDEGMPLSSANIIERVRSESEDMVSVVPPISPARARWIENDRVITRNLDNILSR